MKNETLVKIIIALIVFIAVVYLGATFLLNYRAVETINSINELSAVFGIDQITTYDFDWLILFH